MKNNSVSEFFIFQELMKIQKNEFVDAETAIKEDEIPLDIMTDIEKRLFTLFIKKHGLISKLDKNFNKIPLEDYVLQRKRLQSILDAVEYMMWSSMEQRVCYDSSSGKLCLRLGYQIVAEPIYLVRVRAGFEHN